jgi:ABC-2 type transport system permease protein
LPGSVGALGCLLIVNFTPRRRKELLALVILGGVVLAGLGVVQAIRSARALRKEYSDREAVHQLLGRFTFAKGAMMPNHWVSSGLRAAGRGDLAEAGKCLTLIWANGLFLYLLTAAASIPLYRRGFNRLATGGDIRRRWGGHGLDRFLEKLLVFVHPRTRLLIIKDFRAFRRDPQQWAQVLILSGLLFLYIMNIRRMFIGDIAWMYRNSVSFLNVAAVSLLMCTYTGRFIYPMLSLEGRKFWVLGLLPLQREQLLWGKFAFSAAGTMPLALALVLLSDLMLGMPALIVELHALSVVFLSLGLSALSVGLGACMPNFRETDPTKIAVGFGGTLNLVVGLAFLVTELLLINGPWHAMMAVRTQPELSSAGALLVALGAAFGVAVGLLSVVIPLQMGVLAMRRMEF